MLSDMAIPGQIPNWGRLFGPGSTVGPATHNYCLSQGSEASFSL